MKYWLALFAVFCVTVAVQGSVMILADPVPEPCKPENEADIETDDPLVNHMFEAYKKQAQSESPPAEHATTLTDVNAHEMLGRLFFFLDKQLRETEENTPSDSTAKYFFDLVKTDESRWAADRKWPYRCYQVDAIQALDNFLVGAMKLISQRAKQNQLDYAMFAYSIYMMLPQLTTYVLFVRRSPLHQLCHLVHSSEDVETDAGWIIEVIQSMSSTAETACQPPYEHQIFCNLPAVVHDLDYMAKDYKRAGSSQEMKLFAFFWFLAPGVSNICSINDRFTLEFTTNVLTPHATAAVARLDEIAQLSSTSGSDLEKMRTFIYDYVFNYFRRHAAREVELDWSTQSPFSDAESPESKYNTMTAQENMHPNTASDFLTYFKTFIAILSDMETALANNADISEIHSFARTALLWFLHPNFQLESFQHYDSFLTGLSYTMEHTDLLVKLGNAVTYYRNTICESSNTNKPVKFCNLYDILRDVQVFAFTLDETPTLKILNPSSNYKKILELSTMRAIQTDIAALDVGQEQLEQSLFNMRSSLGDHFYQLATFDQDKAEYDVGFLQDKINDFSQRIANTKIKEDLQTLLYYAIGSNAAEMTQLSMQLSAALAENMNPLAWISGGGGVQEVLDQANALAEAGVDTAKLGAIRETVLPGIVRRANKISRAMAANAEIHDKLNVTFHSLKDEESIDIETVQSGFLIDYKGYDPGWTNGDIAAYTVLLKGVIEELCNILYAGGTAASAVVQIIGATKTVCLNVRTKAEILEAVYLEMYGFQYDFMESMAIAIRALVTKHSANTVRNIPEEEDNAEQYRLLLKFYTFRIKLQSKQHILLALKEVCNVDEYKNGGVPTSRCNQARESQMFSDIDNVIGHNVNECPSDQTNEFFVRFPARLNPDNVALEPGVLDLTKIYSGELTPFKIPYSQSLSWIQKYVSYSIPSHEDVALYVNRFEIYLPDLTNNVQHDITVTVKQDGLMNVSPGGGVKYGFSTPKVFNLVYGENKQKCVNGFDESPYPDLCSPTPSDVCVASHGVVSDSEIAPPLHSNWLIQFILPRDLPMPKPTSQAPFYLRGVLSICYKNPMNIDLSDLPRPSVETGGSSEDRCCPDQQYWYISEFFATIQGCQDCPANSRPNLGGLYCEDTSQPEEGHRHHHKKSVKHHHGHHRDNHRCHHNDNRRGHHNDNNHGHNSDNNHGHHSDNNLGHHSDKHHGHHNDKHHGHHHHRHHKEKKSFLNIAIKKHKIRSTPDKNGEQKKSH